MLGRESAGRVEAGDGRYRNLYTESFAETLKLTNLIRSTISLATPVWTDEMRGELSDSFKDGECGRICADGREGRADKGIRLGRRNDSDGIDACSGNRAGF